MKITILGSGTGVPSLKRSACATLIETGGYRLVIDTGPGTMHRLLEAGVSIFEIDTIFYTHFHPDHTAELVPLLFASKYPGASRSRPLTLLGAEGFLDFYEGLKAVFGSWIEWPPGELKIEEFDSEREDSRTFPAFELSTAPMNHNPESLGVRITDAKGHAVVLSGDTDYCSALVDLAHGADLLICEAAAPEPAKVAGHLIPSEAGDIASRANIGKLILTHFYPETENTDIEKACRKTYTGPLLLARDLMQIVL